MKVILYSTSSCPYCKMVKDYLTQKKIDYSEKLVDSDENSKKEMINESGGFLGVPFIVIEKDDGEKEKIVGFDKGKLDKIIQYLLIN